MTKIFIGIDAAPEPRLRLAKGKSLLELPDNYTVIDLETTGFDPRYDEILEVAAIRFVEGREDARFQSLIKPAEDIPDFIEELTGITNAMLADAPDLNTVLPQFQQFLGQDILMGHNVHFDINFLYDCFTALGLPALSNNFVDTLRLSRHIFPELPNHKLKTICKHCGVSNESEHRAMSDCERTQKCYAYMVRCAEDKSLNLKEASSYNALSKSLHAATDQFNTDSPIYGKKFAFTGKLELCPRREAMQRVLNAGGF